MPTHHPHRMEINTRMSIIRNKAVVVVEVVQVVEVVVEMGGRGCRMGWRERAGQKPVRPPNPARHNIMAAKAAVAAS